MLTLALSRGKDMPIYDYNCPACGNAFEARRGWNDDPAADCPKCGTAAVKQFAIPTVVYKGSGFYTTDHGSRSGAGSSTSSTSSTNNGSSSSNGASSSTDSSKASSNGSSSGSSEAGSSHGHSHSDGSHSH